MSSTSQDPAKNKRRVNRIKIRLWLIILGTILVKIELIPFVAGCLFVLLGSSLRLWAKGFLTQRIALTTSGPYRFTRNPFYLGNALLDLGICFIINQPLLILPYFLLWATAHFDKIFEEESNLRKQFGEEYVEYQKRVSRIVPLPWKIFPRSKEPSGFSWKNENLKNRNDIPRFIQALAYPFLLLFADSIKVYQFHSIYTPLPWIFLLTTLLLGFTGSRLKKYKMKNKEQRRIEIDALKAPETLKAPEALKSPEAVFSS